MFLLCLSTSMTLPFIFWGTHCIHYHQRENHNVFFYSCFDFLAYAFLILRSLRRMARDRHQNIDSITATTTLRARKSGLDYTRCIQQMQTSPFQPFWSGSRNATHIPCLSRAQSSICAHFAPNHHFESVSW